MDAVQASKFITTKKSRELIAKLETLCGREQAKQLHRQVVVTNRSKAVNENIYYNVGKNGAFFSRNGPKTKPVRRSRSRDIITMSGKKKSFSMSMTRSTLKA